MRQLTYVLIVSIAAVAMGCSETKPMAEKKPAVSPGSETPGSETPEMQTTEMQTTESGEPAYITVQHCLIAFRGTGTKAIRTQAEAERLALELFEQLQGGADFDGIIRKYTDDSPPGIYRMANTGFEANMNRRDPIYARGKMVAAFGDTGFPLEVGEYGLAVFDEKNSPFGWHIVKRTE